MPYYNYEKLSSFRKSTITLRKNDLENYFDEIQKFFEKANLKNQF